MARSIFCSVCKKEKEPGRDNESCCKKCKSDRNKANRLKARLEKGMRPLGSGRDPLCYTCGQIKENPKVGYCNSCHRKRDNDWRLKTGRTLRHRTGKCRCGNEIASYSTAYCSKCASQWRRKYLDNNPEIKSRLSKQNQDYRFRSFDDFVKYWARYSTSNAIKRGMIIKMPCEICGTNELVEAHHEDYSKPFDVKWLCRTHHGEHHKELKTISKEN
jgi:hypothetical protein